MNIFEDIAEIKRLADEILADEKEVEIYRSDPFWNSWMKRR